ncbi:hypothetical protein BU25DRAFT_215487 [Macroventuria anomochaeta]|uniref:Uncharacterized protein n=1 Tax=Macroventuria anomochaeta TaxID=301207 RepID=A0ACB6RJE6_9PLEO|nr:uncharacterized protein BU25DRAFT_215487 [Macroventuria anomochaeta]KAF2622116.1 hypothetical protein BU25DRAFT_215487 [Macroventuria anomochaeta]
MLLSTTSDRSSLVILCSCYGRHSLGGCTTSGAQLGRHHTDWLKLSQITKDTLLTRLQRKRCYDGVGRCGILIATVNNT